LLRSTGRQNLRIAPYRYGQFAKRTQRPHSRDVRLARRRLAFDICENVLQPVPGQLYRCGFTLLHAKRERRRDQRE
jgi:hypothetical protein